MSIRNGYQTSRAARRNSLAILVALFVTSVVHAQSMTYTTDTEFNGGFPINSEGVADAGDGELAIKAAAETLPNIWVACSERGTIVRIDTQTRTVLGEYLSSPTGCGRDPSRTTVDFDGSVWAGNRDDNPGQVGSVVKIGSGFAFQWIDRDSDTLLDTSTGLGDVFGWDDNRNNVCTAAGTADTIPDFRVTSGTRHECVTLPAVPGVVVGVCGTPIAGRAGVRAAGASLRTHCVGKSPGLRPVL